MLVGLDINWRAIVAAHLDHGVPPNIPPRVEWVAKPVSVDGNRIGRASSITWGPSVDRLIGFGHLDKALGEPGTQVSVDWAIPGTNTVFVAPATVSKLPFLQHRRTAG